MEELVHLNDTSLESFIERVDFNDTEKILECLEDYIDHLPSMLTIVSSFILKAVKISPILKDKIAEILMKPSSSEIINISKTLFLACLGGQTNITLSPIGTLFPDLSLLESNLNRFDNSVEIFSCYTILRNFSFYKPECLKRLKRYSLENIIKAIMVEESFYDISMLIELYYNPLFFLEFIKHINNFKKRNEILALIFIAFYDSYNSPHEYSCLNNIEEQEIFRNLFTDETKSLCEKIGNLKKLGKFLDKNYEYSPLPSMRSYDFLNCTFESRDDFFKKFILVSSPSITHFLSYMEEFKDKFIMNEEEQIIFLKILFDFHKNNPGYTDIACEKMLKFGIIKSEIMSKFSTV